MNANTEVVKKCSKCGGPRKNDAYGTKCEDCYCDGLSGYAPSAKNGLYPRGTKVIKDKPKR